MRARANIRAAVELVLDYVPGFELAMNVLRHIQSLRALEMAYAAYKDSTGQRASAAVWLIKHIAHPHALNWVAEFLADENVAGWGIDVPDQLLWTHEVDPDDSRVASLLHHTEQHPSDGVREGAAFIRKYLSGREE
jgi:hypothetical protein